MGLRTRLLLLVALATLPALLLAVYTHLDQRRAGIRRVERDAVRLVQLQAAKQLGLVESTRQLLAGFARLPGARATNLAVFDRFFGEMPKTFPDYVDLGLVETNGDLVACAFTGRRPTNLAKRAFVSRVLETSAFASGEYHPGDAQLKPNVTFGHPVLDGNGHLIRILYAALDLAAINQALSRTTPPDRAVLRVLDSSGHVLASNPESRGSTGQVLNDPSVLSALQTRKEGTLEAPAADGSSGLFAFTSIPDAGSGSLFVSVAIPLELAYAETKHLLALNLGVLSAVAGLALLAAWVYANRYILHPLKALTASSQRVAAGDLSTRTGIHNAPGEVNQLARAFDQMAESLEGQRQANEEAQKALQVSEERLRAFSLQLEERVKERTAELEHANRELEAFSYSVSHDLRAPLRHIHGYVEKLQDESGDSLNPDAQRSLTLIAAAAKRMGALIDDLLAFSRMNRAELTKRPVSTNDLVQEVLRELKGDSAGRNIVWTIPKLPIVVADHAMLKQVWANLLSNAIKYTRPREQAEISIRCLAHDHEVEFQVQDNGVGFDMRYADKLFRVFERLHRFEDFEGTGIGLANVRRIVSRHGGRTWAEGQVDRGAVFHFTLPRPPDAGMPPGPAA